MKKRYIGVLNLTEQGDGVIDIIGEESGSSLTEVEKRYRAIPAGKAPC